MKLYEGRVLHVLVNLGCSGLSVVVFNLLNSFPGVHGVAALNPCLEEAFFHHRLKKIPPFHPAVADGSNIHALMNDYDILHLHWTYPAMLSFDWTSFVDAPYPIVTTLHTMLVPFRQTSKMNPVAVSRAVKEMQYNSCEVIHNGIDLAPFVHDRVYEDKPVLKAGFVCRLDGKTYPDSLSKMLKAVSKMSHPVQWVVIGGGDENLINDYKQQTLNVNPPVQFLGWRNDIGECLKDLDLFIYPTWIDAAPICVIEAMASGLPIVAPPVGGLVEMLADGRGLLTSFEWCLDEYMPMFDDAVVREYMGQKAKAYAIEHFQLDRMVREYSDLYERVIFQ